MRRPKRKFCEKLTNSVRLVLYPYEKYDHRFRFPLRLAFCGICVTWHLILFIKTIFFLSRESGFLRKCEKVNCILLKTCMLLPLLWLLLLLLLLLLPLLLLLRGMEKGCGRTFRSQTGKESLTSSITAATKGRQSGKENGFAYEM